MFGQRQARMGRGHAVAAFDPGLGTEVFEIDPHRFLRACRHGVEVGVGQFAGECFDDHIGNISCRKRRGPVTDFDAFDALERLVRVDCGAETRQRTQVIHPEPDGEAMLVRQLTGKSPTDADVAIVVHHGAENVPSGYVFHGGYPIQESGHSVQYFHQPDSLAPAAAVV